MKKDLKAMPRYCGIASFMGVPHTKDLKGADAVIAGIPFEMGSAPGNIFAAKEMRNVSWLLRSASFFHMIDVREKLNIVDYGDFGVFTGDWKASFPIIEAELTEILASGAVPICMGGCHSITYPELKAFHKYYPDLALIQIDAHTDTHDSYFAGQRYTSGSVIRRAVEDGLVNPKNTIQVGIHGTMYSENDVKQSLDLGIGVITMNDFEDIGVKETVSRIRDCVGNKPVFLTFDMDAVDPAYAPGTARAEPNGLTSRELFGILKGLAGLDFVGFDTAEINPSWDVANMTTILGCNVIFEFLALIALKQNKK